MLNICTKCGYVQRELVCLLLPTSSVNNNNNTCDFTCFRLVKRTIPIWSLWPNIRFLPSIVAEKNVTKNVHILTFWSIYLMQSLNFSFTSFRFLKCDVQSEAEMQFPSWFWDFPCNSFINCQYFFGLSSCKVSSQKCRLKKQKPRNKNKHKNPKWFNGNLQQLHQNLFSYGKVYTKYPKDPAVKNNFYKLNREYNKTRKSEKSLSDKTIP
jgi:hypothetical protein